MRTTQLIFAALAVFVIAGCASPATKEAKQERVERFFSDDSFWNTPLPENAEVDPRSEEMIGYLKKDHSGKKFGINTYNFTIPVYEADSTTPRVKMKQFGFAESAGFTSRQSEEFSLAEVPVPSNFEPSPGGDMHATVIDRDLGIAWDMFYVVKDSLGEWSAATGMVVDLRGDGIFDPKDFPVKDGETIHYYGPSRAAGVPSFAGLIMYDEAAKGEINHKIACALRFVDYKRFVYPAIWTDGNFEGGVPEGATIQLDPNLDLSQFDLLPGDRAVAVALQKYGAVVMDFAAGSCFYAEALLDHKEGLSWSGILTGWDEYTGTNGIESIPLDHFRVLKLENVQTGGDRKKEFFLSKLEGWEDN